MLSVLSAPDSRSRGQRRHAQAPPPAVSDARRIRNAAVRALLQELLTYPKPGLVSLLDSGSHDDMTAATFLRSTFALRRFFEAAALAGASGPERCTFERLRCLGVDAEMRMRRATGGVNTHRGAIFNLGLLAAAAGLRHTQNVRTSSQRRLGALVARAWGAEIVRHRRDVDSHGSVVSRRFGVGGALAEAAAGFPSVYEIALPAYRQALDEGASTNRAAVQAFFALLERLADTNLLHRGGASGLAFVQAQAASFLARGGVHRPDWQADAAAVHRALIARRLSPGGAADLLAACLFTYAIEG